MREILFRGKRKDDWVYGHYNYCGKNNVHEIISEEYDYIGVSVDKKTIGQFTGSLDKNGNKIFEGDKFKPDESIEEVKCIVRWDDEFSKFVVDSYSYNFHIGEGSQEVYDNELSIVDTFDLADMILEYCEIIGNIHDSNDKN